MTTELIIRLRSWLSEQINARQDDVRDAGKWIDQHYISSDPTPLSGRPDRTCDEGSAPEPDLKLFDRLEILVDGLVSKEPNMDTWGRDERLKWSARALVALWIMADPDAGDSPIQITRFQEWPWLPSDDTDGPISDNPRKHVAAIPDTYFIGEESDACIDRDLVWHRAMAAYCRIGICEGEENQPARYRLLALLRLASLEEDITDGQACGKEAAQSFNVQQQLPVGGKQSEPVSGVGAGGMVWEVASKRAEQHVREHDGVFPSKRKLAKIVGCSRPTVDKIIKKSTYLKARHAEAERRKSRRTVPLSEPAIDEVSDRLHDDDNLEALIADQEADMRREKRQAQAAKKHRS